MRPLKRVGIVLSVFRVKKKTLSPERQLQKVQNRIHRRQAAGIWFGLVRPLLIMGLIIVILAVIVSLVHHGR